MRGVASFHNKEATMPRKQSELWYKAVDGTSVRAKYTHAAAAMHNIEISFVTEAGDVVKVEMDHDVAAKVIEQAIAAYTAIQRPLNFPRAIPWS